MALQSPPDYLQRSVPLPSNVIHVPQRLTIKSPLCFLSLMVFCCFFFIFRSLDENHNDLIIIFRGLATVTLLLSVPVLFALGFQAMFFPLSNDAKRKGLLLGPNQLTLYPSLEGETGQDFVVIQRHPYLSLKLITKEQKYPQLIVRNERRKPIKTIDLKNLDIARLLRAFATWQTNSTEKTLAVEDADRTQHWMNRIYTLHHYTLWLPTTTKSILPKYPFDTDELVNLQQWLKKNVWRIKLRDYCLMGIPLFLSLAAIGQWFLLAYPLLINAKGTTIFAITGIVLLIWSAFSEMRSFINSRDGIHFFIQSTWALLFLIFGNYLFST